MKKIIAILFLLYLFYGSFTYTNLSEFGSPTKTVEVKGEVLHPGVYESARHASINDLIAMAGGTSPEADTSDLNLTQDVANQSVIVVRAKQEQPKISINSASITQLDTLPGVGPAVANRIIEYRTHTPFKTMEELKNVKGIGDKMFEKLKDSIVL